MLVVVGWRGGGLTNQQFIIRSRGPAAPPHPPSPEPVQPPREPYVKPVVLSRQHRTIHTYCLTRLTDVDRINQDHRTMWMVVSKPMRWLENGGRSCVQTVSPWTPAAIKKRVHFDHFRLIQLSRTDNSECVRNSCHIWRQQDPAGSWAYISRSSEKGST
jgi:hypothetical protein